MVNQKKTKAGALKFGVKKGVFWRKIGLEEIFLWFFLLRKELGLAHELVHYFQFAKHRQSSCESNGMKDTNGNFLALELVSEHSKFTKAIKTMIVNSREYPTLEKYWKAC